ncbi:unnamed protein product, partial [Polarella glacialis]
EWPASCRLSMGRPTLEGSAGIFRFEDLDRSVAKMRSCLREAILAAGGSAAEGAGDRSAARVLPGSPEGDPAPHLPDIVHSTVLRWTAAPEDAVAAREAFERIAASWEPLQVAVPFARGVFEDTPYMHIPDDPAHIWWEAAFDGLESRFLSRSWASSSAAARAEVGEVRLGSGGAALAVHDLGPSSAPGELPLEGLSPESSTGGSLGRAARLRGFGAVALWDAAGRGYVSRAFGWRAFPEGSLGDPGFQSDALCPFLDALNHNRKAQVEFVFSPHSAQILLASSAEGGYEAGDEVFMLYGAGLGNEALLSRYGFSLPRNPHDRVEEVAFHLPPGTSPSAAAERLAALRAALPAVVATQAAPGLITVKLSEGLRRRVDETSVELLRAASLLASGRDYDDLEASCAEKRDAAKATAAALRGMLRGTAAGKAQPRSGLLLALRRRRRTRAVLQAALKSGQRKTSSRPPPPPPPPAAGATGRAAALYAWGRRRILRDAASCATTEAEMAQLAAQMHQGEGGEEQEAEEQSEQEGDE